MFGGVSAPFIHRPVGLGLRLIVGPVCAPFVASLLKLEVRCFKRPALI